jgi:hypothetical protein
VADGGGGRPESVRGRGASVVGGSGLGAGSGGESWALERRSQRGVEMGERAGQRAGRERLSDSATEGGGGRGGVRRGVPRGVGVPWGLAPIGGRHRHQPESGAGGRCAPRARVLDREGREASDGWAGTVPGGDAADRRVRPVSGVGERGARMCVGRPEKKRRWPPGCTALDLFESV